MTMPSFRKLFAWELGDIPRRPLFWMVLAILCAAFIWGALNNAAVHQAQNRSMQLAAAEDAAWQEDLRTRAQRYAQPSGEQLLYWQDPTDIDGFSRYFLRESAVKPHLPLSILSTGQSDLLPYLLPMKLETPFGAEPLYDFEHPRGLALGLFDLGFTIVFFLPIGVIFIASMLGAYERDHGILKLVAAQAVSPRMLLGTRVLALTVWLVPLMLVAVLIALAVAGASLTAEWPGLLAALVSIAAYTVLWLAVGYFVLTFQRGAAASAGIMIGIWAVFAIVVPQGATLAGALLAPPNSYVRYIDELRYVNDQVMEEGESWNGAIRRWLESRPEPGARTIDPGKLTFAAHMVFAAPERERLLQPRVDQMRAQREAAARWTPVVELLSPPAAMQHALSTLAGTDPARHERFNAAVRAYQLQLRDFIYPMVKEQMVNPRQVRCSGCPGRLTFVDHGSVPRFEFPASPTAARVSIAWRWSALFVAFSVLLACVANVRARVWRAGELQFQ